VSARRLELPVVVVGAGPAGLMAAVALAGHGIECLVVERRREPATLPRATAISTRSMELLRSWGLEEEVRAGGADSGRGRPQGGVGPRRCGTSPPLSDAEPLYPPRVPSGRPRGSGMIPRRESSTRCPPEEAAWRVGLRRPL
jgi:choline dehydrogenase-like flavoprotein